MTKTQDNIRRKMKFLEFTFHEAERMKSLGRIGVSKNYANSARQLQKHLATIKKKDVSFRKLSAGLLKDFEDWLHQNGVCRNTSSAYLRCLHTVWNRAVANGRKVIAKLHVSILEQLRLETDKATRISVEGDILPRHHERV